MTQPAVTVIVPVYNAERHIRETLESIAAQSLSNLEVIVVDDGSTDASIKIVKGFVSRDDRFRLITRRPQGSAGAARNVGLEHARGDYLAFLDADDLFAPTMLQKLHYRAIVDDADIVMTAFRSFRDGGKGFEPLGRRGRLHTHAFPKKTPFAPAAIRDYIFTAPHTTVWNKLFKAEFIRRIGLEFEPVQRSNDAYFNMMALAQAEALSVVNEPLVYYRASNKDSLQGSQNETDLSWADATRAVARDLKAKGLYETYRRAMIQRVATRSFDRLMKATTSDGFMEIYDVIRNSIFPDFELDRASVNDFPDPAVGHQVAEFLRLPVTEWLHSRPSPVVPRIKTYAGESASTPNARSAVTHARTAPGSAADGQATVPADVSVIVSISNSSSKIQDCLQSALNQTGVQIELICIADSPPRDTLRQVEEQVQNDARIKLIAQPGSTEAHLRNEAIKRAAGRFVIQIDSDNMFAGDFLAEAVAEADQAQADVLVLGGIAFLDGTPPHEVAALRLSKSNASAPLTSPGPGHRFLSTFRESRHLKQSLSVLFVRRTHLSDIDLRFMPGLEPEDGLFTLSLLLRTDRVAQSSLCGFAKRVHRSAAESPSVGSVQSKLGTYLAMREIIEQVNVEDDSPRVMDAILADNLARAASLFAGLSQTAAREVRASATSRDYRVVLQQIAREQAAEAKVVRKQ